MDGSAPPAPALDTGDQLGLGKAVQQVQQEPQFTPLGQWGSGGIGWMWVNLAFLAGGLFLIGLGTIAWHIPHRIFCSA